MNDKFLSFLGICKKANKLGIGLEISKARKDQAHLFIVAVDSADNTKEVVSTLIQDTNIPQLIKYTKLELGTSIGERETGVISVLDSLMAKNLISLSQLSKGE